MLTTRENEILVLIAQEKTTQEMAEILFLSFATVESHRRNMIKKMNVKNSIGLIIIAIKKGYLEINSI